MCCFAFPGGKPQEKFPTFRRRESGEVLGELGGLENKQTHMHPLHQRGTLPGAVLQVCKWESEKQALGRASPLIVHLGHPRRFKPSVRSRDPKLRPCFTRPSRREGAWSGPTQKSAGTGGQKFAQGLRAPTTRGSESRIPETSSHMEPFVFRSLPKLVMWTRLRKKGTTPIELLKRAEQLYILQI